MNTHTSTSHSTAASVPAAQYVRMSTEHQQYSTENQRDAIADFAKVRGYDVVKTYADDGKSGLSMEGRASLRQMLADVESGTAPFKAILVYDVSRWGACIYETCLDVSFGRSGGCIGVVRDKHKGMLKDIVNKADRIERGDSRKAQVITQFLDQPEHKRLFTELPRRLRQAMAAIDGALVLNHRGEVLAVGAIVKVESGSDAGARKAAAKALARMGFGVKISADGGVVGFCGDGASKDVKRVFEFG
jgi:hypothetical protein